MARNLFYPRPATLDQAPPLRFEADDLAHALDADLEDWLGGEAVTVDEVFAGEFENYLDDLDPVLCDETVVRVEEWPGIFLAQTDRGESVLLSDQGCAPDALMVIGYYAGPQIIIADAFQGRGLGTTLVLAHAVTLGESPQAPYDKVGYSPAGLSVHEGAWRRGREMLESMTAAPRQSDALSPTL